MTAVARKEESAYGNGVRTARDGCQRMKAGVTWTKFKEMKQFLQEKSSRQPRFMQKVPFCVSVTVVSTGGINELLLTSRKSFRIPMKNRKGR